MAFIEALGVDIAFVDVDLDQFNPSFRRDRDQLLHDRRSDPAAPKFRGDVHLVEQCNVTRVPDVGPQRDERYGLRRR